MSLPLLERSEGFGHAVVHIDHLLAEPHSDPVVHELAAGEVLVFSANKLPYKPEVPDGDYKRRKGDKVISVDPLTGALAVIINETAIARIGRRTIPAGRVTHFSADGMNVSVAWGETAAQARRTAHHGFAGRRRAAHN